MAADNGVIAPDGGGVDNAFEFADDGRRGFEVDRGIGHHFGLDLLVINNVAQN
jgi:hypothetical protein